MLQAADILLYHADRVPVGDDQRQHIELTRDIAQRFNARYGETFTVPEAAIPAIGGRVMDLQEPTRKMSTTGGTPQGTVLLTDPPEVVAKKVRSAVTDSGREVRRGEGKEGIANLIEILGDRHRPHPRAGRGRTTPGPATASSRATSPTPRGRVPAPDAGAVHRAARRRDRAARASSPPAPSGRTAVAAPTLATMKARMGFDLPGT